MRGCGPRPSNGKPGGSFHGTHAGLRSDPRRKGYCQRSSQSILLLWIKATGLAAYHTGPNEETGSSNDGT